MKPTLRPLGTSSRRSPQRLSADTLVTTRLRDDAAPYPLIVESREAGLDLAMWARESRDFLDRALVRHGAVLLRGFRSDGANTLDEFVRASGSEPLPYTERSSPRDVVKGHVYTSTSHPSESEIFLHNEQSYNLGFPGRIQFHCVTPPAEGGATPIACTRRVLRELPVALVERFLASSYRYIRNFGGMGLGWRTAFQTDDMAEVERYCRANQIDHAWLDGGRLRTSQTRRCVARHPVSGELAWFNHATFFHVSTLPRRVVDTLRSTFGEDEMPNNTFYGNGAPIEDDTMATLRAAYERAKVAIPWQRGDCLVLDNILMAHGRESFRGDRNIVVAMSNPTRWADVAVDELPNGTRHGRGLGA
ncbi:TauD/TfdA family dioxygenase [Paraliomyxa miuraensis]|uniref:TauD/TfdA family dioxygenase n=1 Tax=Paraliomyxa miuraensis TaxID=376150 RepID=UPI002256A746|nr:TauD/TfdA family dioxygenase [Paraliomyxa miuraensis]MCX4247330.1 TauD/TfdA family dioxygenase [Paraliomyxa miuraensis]